jgi:ABC-type glycerol-3-phosphate transport system substrate-binding protein
VIRRILGIALVAAVLAAAAYLAATPGEASASATHTAMQPAGAQAGQADKNWIARSNEFANMLIAIEKKHSPESASSEGLSEYDEKISAATHEDDVAETSETRAVLAKFQEQLPKEQDKYVRQDLEIMIHSTQLNLKQHDFAETHQIPYINASGAV